MQNRTKSIASHEVPFKTDIGQLQPDVVHMDIDMPLVNGVEAVRRIRRVKADLPIIMLTVFDDNENIFNAICAGASGYILKRYASAGRAAAIRNAVTGGAPMTGLVAKKALQMIPSAKQVKNIRYILRQTNFNSRSHGKRRQL